MRDVAYSLRNLGPEELDALVAGHEARYQDLRTTDLDAAGITDLFEWLQALTILGRHEAAGKLFRVLEQAIESFRERKVDEAEGLEFLYEWSLLALNYTPESRDSFVCLPIYTHLFEALAAGPEAVRYRSVQAQLQLMRHYQYWQEKGGRPERLDDAAREFLEQAEATYDAESDKAIELAEAREDYIALVRLYRNAAQFYFLQQEPNDGIGCLKTAMEYLPRTNDYHPADTADMLLEIGQVFFRFKKYSVALKYFQQAQEIYLSGGEEFEMFLYQAEGWIDECRKMGA